MPMNMVGVSLVEIVCDAGFEAFPATSLAVTVTWKVPAQLNVWLRVEPAETVP